MAQGVLDTRPARLRLTEAGWLAVGMVLLATVITIAGVVAVTRSGQAAASGSLRPREPQVATSVLTGSPAIASASAARTLIATAPAAVLASTASRADVLAADAIAQRAHAPLLLVSPAATAAEVSALRGAIRALAPSAVLAVGVTDRVLAADLPRIHFVTAVSALPVITAAAPMTHVVVLVHTGS
jgi:hypothetical protein